MLDTAVIAIISWHCGYTYTLHNMKLVTGTRDRRRLGTRKCKEIDRKKLNGFEMKAKRATELSPLLSQFDVTVPKTVAFSRPHGDG
jgi:hypothetical protein